MTGVVNAYVQYLCGAGTAVGIGIMTKPMIHSLVPRPGYFTLVQYRPRIHVNPPGGVVALLKVYK
jgi:4-amino-4-deoxy-L-arabinose transferase-like glycosyltransferase